MAKITWGDRSDSISSERKISANIFNDIKDSVNDLYDTVKAQLGTTSSIASSSLHPSGTIFISGSIIPNTSDGDGFTSSFDLGSPTAAWGEIYVATSSLNFVDGDGTITKWSKDDVTNLKAGKPISTDTNNALVSVKDSTTYIRTSQAGRMAFYIGGNPSIDLTSNSITLGGLNTSTQGLPVSVIQGINITGSTKITGSTNIAGSIEIKPPSLTNKSLEQFVLWYNYTFETDGSSVNTDQGAFSVPMAVNGPLSNSDPLTTEFFRFTTRSIEDYGVFNLIDSLGNLNNLAFSQSLGNPVLLTFEPETAAIGNLYEFSYQFTVTGATLEDNNIVINTQFFDSFSQGPNTVPPLMDPYGFLGKFTFSINNTISNEGGYTVGDLLSFLANFGNTVPPGSLGDINFDGQVSIADTLLLLQGFGNPNTICGIGNLWLNDGVNHVLAGPTISICSGNNIVVPTNSVCSITS